MKLEQNQGIKVIKVDPDDGSLRSCHGGDFTYDSPVLKDSESPDSWTPSAWTEPVVPKICSSGYHLTDNPLRWWNRNGRAYLAEYKGVVSGSFDDSMDRKISVESCRLLRPLTAAELAEFNIFIEGEHRVVGDAVVHAYGNAVVYADGNAVVHAYGDAVVYAYGDAVVHADGNARVYADGDTVVYAYGNAVVYANGNAVVYANGNAVVHANGNAKVYANGNAGVYANGNAKVYAYGNAKVVGSLGFTGTIRRP